MDNNAISIDQLSSEQHQNLTENGTKPREISNGIKQATKTEMNPTPLYTSFFFFS